MNKKERIFVSVISNLLVGCMIALIFVSCFFTDVSKSTRQTANSEYAGTIFAGDKTTKNISLMINVYWGTEFLSSMLDSLDKYGAKATFFVGGTWAKDNSEMLKFNDTTATEI